MKVRCLIEFEHTDDFDEEIYAENLLDFIENDEQTYFDRGKLIITTPDCRVLRTIGD